jgi:ribosome-binding protein aMBF1 (putative translation factor)
MATKSHRGKTLWKLPSKGRGTCPVCGTTRIKVLYELLIKDGSKLNVCKRCQHKGLREFYIAKKAD